MPVPSKVTVLLADEDALRRDGLAAVLSGAENYEVVSRVPDGPSALDEIRRLRPDVAVVDLNLPGIHGIELVRRIRAEALRTKVVILAGTNDDEIVREVIRAGGDGYLLKNGPARHLIDAINYVRDGGQYFSPQLRRDGLDRHLLEEPPRQYPVPPQQADYGSDDQYEEDEAPAARPVKAPRPKSRSASHRGGTAPAQWRERMREEADTSHLDDRDYEIMSMMADGIRPILDRLEEIDNRVAQMEVGDAPVPSHPREWLNHEIADTLRDGRGGETAVTGRTAYELEAKLPELIEEAVTRRFTQMAGKLQQEIEETHVRTLETFVKNIQVKLVQRVSALEQDMSKQADAMHQLREYSQRTEDNLSRLITGVDKLAQDLPRRLASAAPEIPAMGAAPRPAHSKPLKRRVHHANRMPKIVAAILGVILVLALGIWGAGKFTGHANSAPADPNNTATKPDKSKVAPPPSTADTKTKLQAASNTSTKKITRWRKISTS